MPATPEITERSAQPYVAIRADVTMEQLPGLADRFGELFGWLAERGQVPAGPPFFRYHVIDMERRLSVEAGVPVPTATEWRRPRAARGASGWPVRDRPSHRALRPAHRRRHDYAIHIIVGPSSQSYRQESLRQAGPAG